MAPRARSSPLRRRDPVGGVGVVGTLSACAATPSCGVACVDIFTASSARTSSPNFVLDVWRQGEKVGQPIILFRTATTTRRRT